MKYVFVRRASNIFARSELLHMCAGSCVVAGNPKRAQSAMAAQQCLGSVMEATAVVEAEVAVSYKQALQSNKIIQQNGENEALAPGLG